MRILESNIWPILGQKFLKILKKLFSKSFFSGVRGKAPMCASNRRRPCRLFGSSKRLPSGSFLLLNHYFYKNSRAFNRDPPPRSPAPERGGGRLVSTQIMFFDRYIVDAYVILCLQIGASLPPSLRKPEGGV